MSIIKHVTLQKIVAHDFRYDPRINKGTHTNTHSEYAIFTAFPLQQWLHASSSLLCSTYIVCVVTQKMFLGYFLEA